VKQVLTKDELKDFWEQLSDQGFDNRLRTFFDMLVILMKTFQSWHGFLIYTYNTEYGNFPNPIPHENTFSSKNKIKQSYCT
jgi:hypothetical protein